MHLLYKQLSLNINFCIKRQPCFSIAQWQFIFHLYFSNQIKFDLESTNQEFFLLLKSLNKQSIQYFMTVFSL